MKKFLLPSLLVMVLFCSCRNPKARDTSLANKPVGKENRVSLAWLNPLLSGGQTIESLSPQRRINLQKRLDSLCKELRKNGHLSSLAVQYVDLANDSSIVINPQLKFAPASLLKIPVLIAIMKYHEETGNILDQRIQVLPYSNESNDPRLEENESYSFDFANTYTVRNLMEIMIAYSDNSATGALLTFMEAKRPGLVQRVEADLSASIPITGDMTDDIVHIGHFAHMVKALYHSRYLKSENSELALTLLNKSRYGSGMRKAIPSDIPMAHKFGVRFDVSETNPEFPVQLHQVAIIYHPSHPFVLSIMSKGTDIEHLRGVMQKVAGMVYEEVNR